MKKLLIIGAGGHGRVVADIALKLDRWQQIAFLDDNQNIKSLMRTSIIDEINNIFTYINDYDIFVGIGANKTREKIQTQLEMKGASIPTLIHPSTIIGEEVDVGEGTVVMAGAVINCCSRIGKGCIVNTGATIDHDNKVEDYVHISPGVHIAGNVQIGKGTWIGIGTTVSNNLKITGDCTVGAGAVVVKDISESGTYIGIPARRI